VKHKIYGSGWEAGETPATLAALAAPAAPTENCTIPTLTAFLYYWLKGNLKRNPPNKIGSRFKKLPNEKVTRYRSLFTKTSKRQYIGFFESFNISLLFSQTAKKHAIKKDLVQPAIKEIIERVMQ